MKIAFISNYFNHHQRFLSRALQQQPDVQFRFIETEALSQERLALGYQNITDDSVIRTYKQEEERNKCLWWIENADALIVGSAPENLIHQRIKNGKLTFRYSERPLKHGNEPEKFIPRCLKWHYSNPQNKNIYLLCAGAFVSSDYSKFGMFVNKSFKWGYFPETRHYKTHNYLFSKKNPAAILWCGRFLNWKHPDDALLAAVRLKQKGKEFRLMLIGTGKMQTSLNKMVEEYGLEDCVEICGPMTTECVREQMERAGIFVFTSDRQEGWGAVLNEAMNSGCAVVASDMIGSVPYLIQNGQNGSVYHSGDIEELSNQLEYLLENPAYQVQLGTEACRTITELWNADLAASRFVKLTGAILEGRKELNLYLDGPCSKAERIKENWYHGNVKR